MFSPTIVLVLVLVSSHTFAEEFPPDYAQTGKSSSMEYQTIQEGKSLTSSGNGDLAKRAPKGFQGMRGKKDMGQDNDDTMINDELEKRGPFSFHGTRGKKEFFTPEFDDSYVIDGYFKRAPMGFQGMRGKKTIGDDDYYKRAAMGFQGMRGKKSPDLRLNQIVDAHYGDGSDNWSAYMFGYPEEYEKRAPSMGFQGMRGKREEFEDLWEKRAPMGFQGMRGKKSLFEEIDDVEKRAPMGFQGMRGKRNPYYDNYMAEQLIPFSGLSRYSNDQGSDPKIKRHNTGFVASRGKRSDQGSYGAYPEMSSYNSQDVLADDMSEELFSRPNLMERMNIVPLEFYKRSAYGYSGTRGKKIPRWEIKGKFIGVRGKRSSKMNYDDNGDSLNNVHSNNERIGVEAGSATKLDENQ